MKEKTGEFTEDALNLEISQTLCFLAIALSVLIVLTSLCGLGMIVVRIFN